MSLFWSRHSDPDSPRRTPIRSRCAHSHVRLNGVEGLESRDLLAFDPTPLEQAFFESVNRTRINPQGELDVIFSSTNPLVARDPEVQGALDFFHVDAATLLAQWGPLTPVPPVAWSEQLSESATTHTQLMISNDMQSHNLPGEPSLGDRIKATGYDFRRASENIYAFAENHLHGHAGFIVDWGEGPGGIQSPAGHRDNYMDPQVVDLGVDVQEESNPITSVGPILVTQHFGSPKVSQNPHILGVVWSDTNRNSVYDPGEGIGGVNVRISGPSGTFETTAMSAGGYQVRVPSGVYEVTAFGGSLANPLVFPSVTVTTQNRKVDFETNTAQRAPMANSDQASLNEDGETTINVLANDVAFGSTLNPASVVISQAPTKGTATVDTTTGRIYYRPQMEFSGSDKLFYTVRDQNGASSNPAEVRITVRSVNDAPVANPTSLNVPHNATVELDLRGFASDPDGTVQWSTLRIVSSPAHGSLVNATTPGTLRFQATSGYSGADQFTYQVADNSGSFSNIATVTINIAPANQPPVATADVFTALAGSTTSLNVLANDQDAEDPRSSLALVIAAQPAHGLVSVVAGQIRLVAASSYTGADTFQYRVRDTAGALSAVTTVSLVIVSPLHPWQNPVNRLNVNAQDGVTPIDALLVINHLGIDLTQPNGIPASLVAGSPPLVDVNGDNVVSPIDALLVINALGDANRAPQGIVVVEGTGGVGVASGILRAQPAPAIEMPDQGPGHRQHQPPSVQIAERPTQLRHVPRLSRIEIHSENPRDEAQRHEHRGDDREYLHDLVHADSDHGQVVVAEVRANIMIDLQELDDLDGMIVAIAEKDASRIRNEWMWVAD